MSIREFAIAAPVAILVAAWARNRADERVWLAGVSGLLAVGVACVLVVAASMPGHATSLAPDLRQVGLLGSAFATLAAVVLPAAALAMGRRIATFSPAQIILGAALGCLIVVLPGGPLIGNLWVANGYGGNFLLGGTRDPVIGASAWALSGQVASFAAILVAALALRWGQRNLAQVRSASTAIALAIRIARRRDAPLVLFLLAYAAELAVFASMGSMFDRYLYPVVPAAAILLLRGPHSLPATAGAMRSPTPPLRGSRPRHSIIATNSFAYDAARYRAGEEAVAMGYDAKTVDAGYEWVGFHMSGPGNPGPGAPA